MISSLDLDKADWVEDIQNIKCSLKGSLFVLVESIHKSRKFKEGLDSTLKVSLYRTFCKATGDGGMLQFSVSITFSTFLLSGTVELCPSK